MDFVHIGYDIRQWPTDRALTTDASEWEVDDELSEQAKRLPGVTENIFQLLEITSEESIEHLARLVDFGRSAALVGFEALRPVVQAYTKKTKISVQESVWGSFDWEFLGYDICDANGLFSILHMGIDEIPYRQLLKEDQFAEALMLTQVASILAPEHAPFVVMKLWRIKAPSV